MSGFSAQWLKLREPHDAKARNPIVLDAVAKNFADRSALAIVDLACGTGATLRAISARLPARQTWRLVDNDLSLLARAAPAETDVDKAITTVPVDIAHDLEAALDGLVDLITVSALLDLVSADWLERLAVEAAARRLPVYAALTYDGRATFDPVDPLDAVVTDAVSRHQRDEKGFGPALGPDAAEKAAAQFKTVRYDVIEGRSDWIFAPRDDEIQMEFLTGWATAARETAAVPLADLIGWLTRRRDHVTGGRSSIRVGHMDFFACPMGTR
jgi:SAM-dependent methyltransferase